MLAQIIASLDNYSNKSIFHHRTQSPMRTSLSSPYLRNSYDVPKRHFELDFIQQDQPKSNDQYNWTTIDQQNTFNQSDLNHYPNQSNANKYGNHQNYTQNNNSHPMQSYKSQVTPISFGKPISPPWLGQPILSGQPVLSGKPVLSGQPLPPQTDVALLQMQTLVLQLRTALEQATSTVTALQDQLSHERNLTFELTQAKRRLEEENRKLRFENQSKDHVDRNTNREAQIKHEAIKMEHKRISGQLDDLVQEIRTLRNQNRNLRTQLTSTKKQLASMSECRGQSFYHQSSHLVRSPSHDAGSRQKDQSKYPNQSGSTKCSPQWNNDPIQQVSQEHSFFNAHQQSHVYRKLSSPNSKQSPTSQDLARQQEQRLILSTERKQRLGNKIRFLREQLIRKIKGEYYQPILRKAAATKSNCFLLFVENITKDLKVLRQICLNYLQARRTVIQQSNCDPELPYSKLLLESQEDQELEKAYYKTLEQAKAEQNMPNGSLLGLFRLLVALTKSKNADAQLQEHVKHAALQLLCRTPEQEKQKP